MKFNKILNEIQAPTLRILNDIVYNLENAREEGNPLSGLVFKVDKTFFVYKGKGSAEFAVRVELANLPEKDKETVEDYIEDIAIGFNAKVKRNNNVITIRIKDVEEKSNEIAKDTK